MTIVIYSITTGLFPVSPSKILELCISSTDFNTETALVEITNDLLCAADSDLISSLIFLHLSAAFDTVSHQLLMDRPASTGLVPPYFADRALFEQTSWSESSTVQHEVPQGSVSGPLLFIF